jgi:glycosyltransferase involved in cell wall biosynthesis
MKTGFISSDWSGSVADSTGQTAPGGACHYRVLLPARALAANGIRTVVGETFRTVDGAIHPIDRYTHVTHDDCDVIVFQRWMHRDALRVVEAARAAGQVVINDVDDLFDAIPAQNQARFTTDPALNPIANRDLYRDALRASTAITVSTPFLKERMERLGVPTMLVRNAVELSAFTRPPFVAHKPTIGWTGSTLHRAGDLGIVRGVLGPFVERHDLKVFHGGANEQAPSFAEESGVDPARLTEVAAVPMDRYDAFFKQFDVGIVPLTDVPFNHAKSSIKGMEYAAAGLPFIASATPEYLWLGAGLVVKKPRDWVRAFERLVEPEERVLLAKEAGERVEAEDIKTRWSDWQQAYQEAMAL